MWSFIIKSLAYRLIVCDGSLKEEIPICTTDMQVCKVLQPFFIRAWASACTPLKNYLFSYLPLNSFFFQNCIMAASSSNGPLTPACVRLKKEIINITLEAGCELITALGTHQHTCSSVQCTYTFPQVEMSSFTVITFLPPLTIDYLHFSIWSPAVEMALVACYGSGGTEVLPSSSSWVFTLKREQSQIRQGARVKRDKPAGTRRNKEWLHCTPTCPLAARLSGRLEVNLFFFFAPMRILPQHVLNIYCEVQLRFCFLSGECR